MQERHFRYFQKIWKILQTNENRISLMKEPDSKYQGYLTPSAGTAKFIEEGYYKLL